MLNKFNVLIDRREMLKVKLISLADEARTIRRLEDRAHGVIREEMRNHRVGTVRWHSRHTHLAYGLVRGRTIEQIEGKAAVEPDWAYVRKMIKQYGPPKGLLDPAKTGKITPLELEMRQPLLKAA